MAEQGEYEKETLSGEAAKWNFMEKYCQLLRDSDSCHSGYRCLLAW